MSKAIHAPSRRILYTAADIRHGTGFPRDAMFMPVLTGKALKPSARILCGRHILVEPIISDNPADVTCGSCRKRLGGQTAPRGATEGETT